MKEYQFIGNNGKLIGYKRDTDIHDDILNINVNYYFDDYYYNKYEDIDMIDEINNNSGLCYTDICFNMKDIDEDLCSYCIEEQQTYNQYENYNDFIKTVIDSYIHPDIIYNIIENIKTENEYI